MVIRLRGDNYHCFKKKTYVLGRLMYTIISTLYGLDSERVKTQVKYNHDSDRQNTFFIRYYKQHYLKKSTA